MRIVIANQNAGVYGGVETYLRELLPLLRERGHEIALFTPEPKPSAGPRLDDRCPEAVWLEFAAIDRWKADVCYLNVLADSDMEAALAQRLPTLLFAHNHYGCCIGGSKRFDFPSTKQCGRRLGPMCLALYLPRRCGGRSPLRMIQEYRSQRCKQRALPRYAGVAVASEAMFDELLLNGVAKERLHLLPIFPAGQAPDSAAPVPRTLTGQVLMLGRLTKLKGGQMLVRSLPLAEKKLGKSLQLIVGGDGPDRQPMEQLAKRLAVNAHFTGWIDSAQREILMRSADVLAVPSLWKEPFGLVGVEAGCVGLPSVAFDVGGISDWLIAGETGEMAPADPPTPGGLASALARCLEDESRWQQLRLGAWAKSKQFSAAAHVDGLERLLRGVVAAGAPVSELTLSGSAQ